VARLLLSFLGARLAVSCDDPGALASLREHLGAFVEEEPESRDSWESGAERPEVLALGPELCGLPTRVFSLVFQELLDRVRTHVVLHAAAVSHAGRAWLLAGPSGSGKTTLALALLERGFPLLSDDFSPLSLVDRKVGAFPKSLGIREGAGHEIAARVVAGRGTGELHAADWDLEPRPLGGVLLLDGGPSPPDPRAPYRLRAECARSPGPLLAALERMAGVRAVSSGDDVLLLEVDPTVADAPLLGELLDRAKEIVVEHGLAARGIPSPCPPPRIVPIDRSRALLLLLRDVQNRHPAGALLERYGGDPGRLAFALAEAVGGVPMAWLAPGGIEETAALVERWLRGIAL